MYYLRKVLADGTIKYYLKFSVNGFTIDTYKFDDRRNFSSYKKAEKMQEEILATTHEYYEIGFYSN